MKRSVLRKRGLSVLLSLTMLISGVPAFAAEDTANSDSREQNVNLFASVRANFGTADEGNNVTGMTETETGYFVMNNSSAGVTISRFDKGNTEAGATASIVFENPETRPITHDGTQNGYIFAAETGEYTAGNTMQNGAIAADAAGNVYAVISLEKEEQLLYDSLYDLSIEGNFAECTCTEDYCTDIKDCGDCPVCTAYEHFQQGFTSGYKTELLLYKMNGNLEMQGAPLVVTSVESLAGIEANCMTVGSDGSIYIGGGANLDLNWKDPVYGYRAFDHHITGTEPIETSSISRGFVVKVKSDLSAVEKATWFGGLAKYNSAYGADSVVEAIAEENGVVYIAGEDAGGKIGEATGLTTSWNEKADPLGTTTDAYIAKLDTNLRATAFTYFGGSSTDSARAMVIGKDCLYLGGVTPSPDLLTHAQAYQRNLNGGTGASPYNDNFVLRLSKDLKKDGTFAATYLGGSSREDLYDIALSDSGAVYITGESYGPFSYPTTDGSGEKGKIFLSRLNGTLSSLEASTILGSFEDKVEQGRALAVDGEAVYLAGQFNAGTYMLPRYQMFLNRYEQNLVHASVAGVQAYPNGFSATPVYMGLGETIKIAVTFDSYVEVTGEPTLALNLQTKDGTCAEAVYESGSGTRELIFSYCIVEGDTTQGMALDCADENALHLNGGSILPKGGVSSEEIDLTVPLGSYELSYANLYISTIPQTVVKVTSTASEGTYGAGASIPITVTFSQPVKVTDTAAGNPELALNNGGTAVYAGKGQKNTQMEFLYTVKESDGNTEALNYASGDSLRPNGAVIVDQYGMEPDFTLPAADSEGSLASQKIIKVNTQMAKIVSVTADKNSGTYKANDTITISVQFDRPVTTTGKAKLSLNLKTVKTLEAEPVENQEKIDFVYKIASGDEVSSAQNADKYLDYSYESLTFVSGGIQDQNGGQVSCYLPKIGGENSLAAAKISLDTIAPLVTYSSKLKNGEDYYSYYYKEGDRLGVKLLFAERVLLDKSKNAELHMTLLASDNTQKEYVLPCIGYAKKGEEQTDYSSLIFEYTVSETDSIADASILSWQLKNTDAIKDAVGNSADSFVSNTSAYIWKFYFDSVAPDWQDSVLRTEYKEAEQKVVLSWDKIQNDISGIERYSVYRSIKGDSNERLLGQGGALSVSYEDTAVLPGVSYIYTVYAEDKAGNISEPLRSAEVVIPGQKPGEDISAPYWASGSVLNAKRTKSTEAELTWRAIEALDDDGAVAGYRLYMKKDGIWGSEPIAEIDDPARECWTVSNITNEGYAFRLTILDSAGHESSLTEAIQVSLEYELPALIICDARTGKVQYEYVEGEIENFQMEDVRVSSKNNENYRYWYSASGVYIEALLNHIGIKEYSTVSVQSGDAMVSQSFTKEEVEGKGFYYFPPGKTEAEKQAVKPILAYIGVSSGSDEPPFLRSADDLALLEPGMELMDGTPRLLFGQRTMDTVNKDHFVKDVYKIFVDYSDDPLYYTPPVISGVTEEDYYVLKGTSISPEQLPEPGRLTAADAYGNPVDASKIKMTVTFKGLEVPAVNTAQPGVYTVTYSAEDARGNIGTLTKQVIVYEQPKEGAYLVEFEASADGSYTEDRSSQVPCITVSGQLAGEKQVSFAFKVMGKKLFNGAQTVAVVQMRGNKMQNIYSYLGEKDVTESMFGGSFSVLPDDKIYVYVLDKLDGAKGSGSKNLLD